MDDDLKLVTKLKSGEEAAYKQLFDLYYQPLVAFARRYVTDEDTARETVQEVIIRIFQRREDLNIESSLKSYLFKAVYNSCLNKIKERKTKMEHHQQIKHMKDNESFDRDVLIEAEKEARIYNEINQLPDRCKQIFMMNRFDGIKNGDIAKELDISVRTVETQISKALKILREKLLLGLLYILIC